MIIVYDHVWYSYERWCAFIRKIYQFYSISALGSNRLHQKSGQLGPAEAQPHRKKWIDRPWGPIVDNFMTLCDNYDADDDDNDDNDDSRKEGR